MPVADLAPNELNSGVGFLGAEGLAKLNGAEEEDAGCEAVEKENPPAGELPNMVWDRLVEGVGTWVCVMNGPVGDPQPICTPMMLS